MFFGNNKSNNNDSINVNTRFEALYSDTSSLVYGGWNNKLSIRLLPAIGKDSNGLTQYDDKAKSITSLSQTNAKALYLAFEKEIKPNIGQDKEIKVSVSISSGTNILSIGYKLDGGNPLYTLELAQGVNSDGIAEDESKIISYTFNRTDVLINYDPKTGSGTPSVENSEFENFYDRLKHIGDLLPVSAHGIRYSDAIGKAYSSKYNNGSNNAQASTDDFMNTNSEDFMSFT